MIKKLILFLLISCGAYAQKISIDLSIEWEKKELNTSFYPPKQKSRRRAMVASLRRGTKEPEPLPLY